MKIKLGKRKKIILFLLIFILIAGALIVLVNKSLNSPAEGTISQSKTYDAFSNNSTDKPGEYSDKYISFTYPSGYKVSDTKKSGNSLNSILLLSTRHTDDKITIGIVRENLSNDSGINYRNSHPEIYKLKTKTNSSAVYTASKNGSEQTGYIQHKDMVISISFTSAYKRDFSKDYQTIVDSLEWK